MWSIFVCVAWPSWARTQLGQDTVAQSLDPRLTSKKIIEGFVGPLPATSQNHVDHAQNDQQQIACYLNNCWAAVGNLQHFLKVRLRIWYLIFITIAPRLRDISWPHHYKFLPRTFCSIECTHECFPVAELAWSCLDLGFLEFSSSLIYLDLFRYFHFIISIVEYYLPRCAENFLEPWIKGFALTNNCSQCTAMRSSANQSNTGTLGQSSAKWSNAKQHTKQFKAMQCQTM